LLHDFDAVALRPNFQLLDSRRAERIRRTEDDVQSLLPQSIRQFPDACSLADAIYTNDKNDARAAPVRRSGTKLHFRRRLNNPRDMRFNLLFELSRICERIAIEFFFYSVQHFSRRFDADVGGNQRRFQVLQNRRINRPFAKKNGIDGFCQRCFGPGDGRFQPLEQRGLGLLGLIFLPKRENIVGCAATGANVNCNREGNRAPWRLAR